MLVAHETVAVTEAPSTDHALHAFEYDPYSAPVGITITVSDAMLAIQSLEASRIGGVPEERAALQRVYAALFRSVYPSLPIRELR